MKSKNWTNEKGLSLSELVVTLGLTTLILGASGYVIQSTKANEVRAEITSSLVQEHLLNIQRSRSSETVRGLMAQGSFDQQKLADCFAGNTPVGGCAKFNQEVVSSGIGESGACAGTQCDLNSQFVLNIECDASRCSRAKVQIKSESKRQDLNLKKLESFAELPISLFASANTVNYSCVNRAVAVFGIDPASSSANCRTEPMISSCQNSSPLKSATGESPCQELSQASCSAGSGIRRFRWISSQSGPSTACVY